MSTENYAATAVAIADILEQDLDLVDQVEGLLLVAGGADETITPARVAREINLDRELASNLFRQLEAVDTVSRSSYGSPVAESSYSIRRADLRELFATIRQAIPIIDTYLERQPPSTEIEPLVTFPDDPAFADTAPAAFEMDQLMSALASEIKTTNDSIILVAPFFEGTGFERLREVLADALERGVELTIVTRYLTDRDSHNWKVINAFVQYLADERGVSDQVQTVDYTVWDESVPIREQTQEGAKPAFTLHAKVMLFDNDTAYVGSANVTDYGFDRYLELGVLLQGPKVSRYRDLCEFLLTSDGATRIDCQ
jgi:putative cardiolipin synthase